MMTRTKKPWYPEATFAGLYNLTIWLKDNPKPKIHKRVYVDNEQHRLGNIRITDEKGEAILYVRSDIRKWQFDSKDCH